MTEYRINSAEASALSTAITDYSVDPIQTDGPTDQKETTWIDTKFNDYLGYYKTIPELRAVIDAKSTWTVGKGFKAKNKATKAILRSIRGFGKDTFNTILENLIRTMNIAGNAYAEVIRNEKGLPINLKPLDPSTIRIVADKGGLILRYEQVSKNGGEKAEKRFEPEKIFHLARNRVADEIHGVSMIESLEWVILAKNECMQAMKTLMQRHVKPRIVYKLETDDETEIAKFKAKEDAANAGGENLYIPKDAVEFEVLAVAPNGTLNPIPWIEKLDNMFYEESQVPKIILGGSGEFTEASAKIAYLAFQQTIEEDQLFIEEQLGYQLGISIELEFPASLENELLSDKAKDGAVNIQPNETTAGVGK